MSAYNVCNLVKGVEVVYADGSKEVCELSTEKDSAKVFRCIDSEVYIESRNSVLGLSVKALKPLSSFFFTDIHLDIGSWFKVLSLTLNPGVAEFYGSAFGYYNPLAVGREPTTQKPLDNPAYPAKISEISHVEFIRRFPCWAYPVQNAIPPYTIFTLLKVGEEYVVLLPLSNGDVVGYLWPGPRLRLFLGTSRTSTKFSWVLSLGIDHNPYEAIKKCVHSASMVGVLKPRDLKKKPRFIDKLGWCSWNALLTEDLSHENVVKIVRGLIERGIPIRWVIVDDGWQNEVKKSGEWFARVLRSLGANEEKFPRGLGALVNELKKLGVELAGLWHTIDIHWSGFEKDVSEILGIQGFRNPYVDAYVPSPELDKAVELYEKFLRWVKGQGFDFVKVDNQWIVHALYLGVKSVGEVAKVIQLALQVGAYVNGLDILNCMSMTPENYCNYFLSNLMRVSIDYIPFWKADAKLHTVFSVYNSLLFNFIAYPDYDMWITYDPYAKIHALARVFSGGPVYITDRYPEKTDVDLVKMLALDDGEVVKLDEPGLPTKDILFRDPYNEKVLLKIAGKVGEYIAVAIFNVNRDGLAIEDEVNFSTLPYEPSYDSYICYSVFSGEKKLISRRDSVKVRLGELEVEVLVFAPLEKGRSVIGLKEYILPPYPVKVFQLNSKLVVVPRARGTMLIYDNGLFIEKPVDKFEIIEI